MANTTHIVMSRLTTMPSSCWGRYVRVAVVEIDPAQLPEGRTEPAMISERARGVVRIVETWERCHAGTTDRSARGRALKEAHALAEELNAP